LLWLLLPCQRGSTRAPYLSLCLSVSTLFPLLFGLSVSLDFLFGSVCFFSLSICLSLSLLYVPCRLVVYYETIKRELSSSLFQPTSLSLPAFSLSLCLSVPSLFPLLDRTVSLSIRRSVSFSLYVPSSTCLSVSSRFLFLSLSLLDFSLSLCLFVSIFFPALSLSLFSVPSFYVSLCLFPLSLFLFVSQYLLDNFSLSLCPSVSTLFPLLFALYVLFHCLFVDLSLSLFSVPCFYLSLCLFPLSLFLFVSLYLLDNFSPSLCMYSLSRSFCSVRFVSLSIRRSVSFSLLCSLFPLSTHLSASSRFLSFSVHCPSHDT
jgi:hypothetical protein